MPLRAKDITVIDLDVETDRSMAVNAACMLACKHGALMMRAGGVSSSTPPRTRPRRRPQPDRAGAKGAVVTLTMSVATAGKQRR
jgi:hypothetical protein